MGGFRCRLGWCLSPGAVFETAAPYSGFLMVVVVSVMLVCGLRLPGFLASSFWFWSGVCCEVSGVLDRLPWQVLWPATLYWWARVGAVGRILYCRSGLRHCWPHPAVIAVHSLPRRYLDWQLMMGVEEGNSWQDCLLVTRRRGAGCRSRRSSVVVAEGTAWDEAEMCRDGTPRELIWKGEARHSHAVRRT